MFVKNFNFLKLKYYTEKLSKIRYIMDSFNVYEYIYKNVLNELNKKFWNDFDYHRDRMSTVFSKIKNIKWIEVDNEFYNDIGVKSPLLECSRYSHRTYEKCYPNSTECYECFKYWCCDCNKGSNSMYFSCNGKRCSRFFNSIPKIFEIKSKLKRIYVFKNTSYDFFSDKKINLINKEIYGF